jgi:acetolactate synthase-1/3 small subunit
VLCNASDFIFKQSDLENRIPIWRKPVRHRRRGQPACRSRRQIFQETIVRYVLSVLVDNEPGVLSRVAGLFSGRGFNIETLNVAPTLENGVSLMTIATSGDSQIIEQIIKQLRKLVTVIKVVDYHELAAVEREMMLIKVQADDSRRGEVLRIADIFRCKVVDVSLVDLTLEATGDQEKIGAIINLLNRFGIKELARTGTLAMKRSMQRE